MDEIVVKALQDFVRYLKVEKIISYAGKLEFHNDWDKIRHGR